MEKFKTLEDLSRRLGVRYDPSDQDWELTNADPERVGEFINFYHSEVLDQGDRTLMVLLIICSLEEKMGQQSAAQALDSMQNWCQLAHILRERQEKYTWIIHHQLSIREWALEEELAECHPLLPLFEEEFGDIT